MPSLRWLLAAGAASLIYVVQVVLSLGGGPALRPDIDRLVRPILVIGLVLAGVSWLLDRTGRRIETHVDRRLDTFAHPSSGERTMDLSRLAPARGVAVLHRSAAAVDVATDDPEVVDLGRRIRSRLTSGN